MSAGATLSGMVNGTTSGTSSKRYKASVLFTSTMCGIFNIFCGNDTNLWHLRFFLFNCHRVVALDVF